MNIQFKTIFPTVGIMVSMLALDAVWLTLRKQYHETLFYSIQKSPLRVNFAAATIVYILMAVAIFHAAVEAAKSLGGAVACGAVVGFFLYAFYDATNMATLSRWTWHMFFTDIAWGTAVSAAGAAVGYAIWSASR
jgi:uncharacterized membrane protein